MVRKRKQKPITIIMLSIICITFLYNIIFFVHVQTYVSGPLSYKAIPIGFSGDGQGESGVQVTRSPSPSMVVIAEYLAGVRAGLVVTTMCKNRSQFCLTRLMIKHNFLPALTGLNNCKVRFANTWSLHEKKAFR